VRLEVGPVVQVTVGLVNQAGEGGEVIHTRIVPRGQGQYNGERPTSLAPSRRATPLSLATSLPEDEIKHAGAGTLSGPGLPARRCVR
jgi:hypothetical protein